MPVGLSNLSGTVQGMLNRGHPDIGQTFYVVDANYRTIAQGWSNGDRTGPLDLWSERNRGYVYRCGAGGEYSTDSAGIQAAIDAMVDFRGDTLFFTPGAYSLAAALTINVPDARWLGPAVSDPRLCRASITDAIGSGCTTTAAADRMEIGFLRFVPLTATTLWNVVANTDKLHFHHFFYDVNGIAASTSTIFLTGAGTTNDDFTFSDFYALTDAAQGPLLSMVGTYRNLDIVDFEWNHEAGTLATCLLLDNSAGDAGGPGPVFIGARNRAACRGNIAGGGAVTNLVALTDAGIDTAWIAVVGFRGAIGFCAAGALISLSAGTGNTAEAAETGVANSYLDVVGAGAGGAGTAYTQ